MTRCEPILLRALSFRKRASRRAEGDRDFELRLKIEPLISLMTLVTAASPIAMVCEEARPTDERTTSSSPLPERDEGDEPSDPTSIDGGEMKVTEAVFMCADCADQGESSSLSGYKMGTDCTKFGGAFCPIAFLAGWLAGLSMAAVPPIDLSTVAPAGAPARASTPPPGKGKPALSSAKRSSSAGKKEKKDDLLLTPRARKATKQLFKELGHVKHTTIHMLKRVEACLCIVNGVQTELILASEGARSRLDANKAMTAMTKPTRGGAGLAAPVRTPHAPKGIRPPNFHELKCLKDELKPDGDPTEDEVEEAVAKDMELKQQAAEVLRTMTGQSNTPIVEALEKLEQSAILLAKELVLHQASVQQI